MNDYESYADWRRRSAKKALTGYWMSCAVEIGIDYRVGRCSQGVLYFPTEYWGFEESPW
jgi:hypothetical protein